MSHVRVQQPCSTEAPVRSTAIEIPRYSYWAKNDVILDQNGSSPFFCSSASLVGIGVAHISRSRLPPWSCNLMTRARSMVAGSSVTLKPSFPYNGICNRWCWFRPMGVFVCVRVCACACVRVCVFVFVCSGNMHVATT